MGRRNQSLGGSPLSRRLSLALIVSAFLLAGGALPAHASGSGYQMPFPCGESWRASTSPTHTPSPLAIDLNVGFHNDDYGRVVIASATGRLHRRKAGWHSYGRYAVIDHGRGRTTIYAHLSKILVRNGARVKQGDPIGLVGNNKGTFDAHLHYEQRYKNKLQRIRFNGRRISYRNNPASVIYRSVNDCGRWARHPAPAAPARKPKTVGARVATTGHPVSGPPVLPLTLLAGGPFGAVALAFVRRTLSTT
jgi:murein DD-endopeptidase MepM/ murein hydrolase activator NlpD